MKKSELRQIIKEEIKSVLEGPHFDPYIKKMAKSFKETEWKMDKFMPEDEEYQIEYYKILKKKDVKEMTRFLDFNADTVTMRRYMPKGATIEDFAKYLIQKD